DSGELLQDEIVKPDSVIPHATLTDYAQATCFTLCFYNCLSVQQPSEADDFQRDLTSLSDSELQLELKLKLRVFASVWTTSYKFILRSSSLAPLDVLAAKLRDQEEEISSLRMALVERLMRGPELLKTSYSAPSLMLLNKFKSVETSWCICEV
uniref:Uncharacterized protein n=1 Tax=Globisporangium ultimum (strain ATCC 200006 / CBS 805.95 / DAOM BR144) TaxID=431595 RepID=K3X5C5_GLOUD